MPLPKTPLLTVDCALFDEHHRALLITRRNPLFKGQRALPGGFVEVGEKVEDACRRELLEETGIDAGQLTLLGIYSDPSRDPRGHVCSVVFAGRARAAIPHAADDASTAAWIKNWRSGALAFDHRQILMDAERLLFGAQAERRDGGE